MIRRQDLHLLRWPLLLAVALIAFGGAAVWLAQIRADAATRAHEVAQQQYRAANARLQRARTDEHTVRDAIARYDVLARQGLIGPERRLEWVETLDAARRRQGIDSISYEILPQQPLDTPAGQSLQWMESRMRLTLQVRHAGVLLGLLDALHEVDSALVLPQACRMARRTDGAGLDGECELRWLTLHAGAPS